jgi:LacI family transcriptional regulator
LRDFPKKNLRFVLDNSPDAESFVIASFWYTRFMSRVRIKDIAEMAHVSIGTVDRVIHNRGEVSAATREKITALIRELDYQPDIAARSLALKRAIRLAVVMPHFLSDHSFWKLPRYGIRRALNALSQYHIEIESFFFDQFDRIGFEDVMKNFPFDTVEGVLFAPVFLDESLEFLRRCEQEKVPVVLFNSMLEAPSVKSFVGQDAYQSGRVAARLLDYGIEAGSNMAIINMSARKDHYTHITDRERGFRSFFEERRERLNRMVTLDLNGADDRRLKLRLQAIFEEYQPAGIFVTNSRVYKVARFLEDNDRHTTGLVGYDLLPENVRYLERGLIHFILSQKPGEQAYLGLNSLFQLVAFHREPEEKQWLPIDIITHENLRYYQTKTLE